MSINKDQVKGRVKEAEGKIKEVTGKLVGNETLELKGKIQKVQGEAQAAAGDLRKDVEDAVKKAWSFPRRDLLGLLPAADTPEARVVAGQVSK